MLIRTNSILKLDLPFIETAAHDDVNSTNIISTNETMVNGSDLPQRYTNDNIKTKKKNDPEPATVLGHDKQGSSFICRTDQDEDDGTQAQTTSFSSSSSTTESIYSKTTITSCLGIHQYASTNCNDAAIALIEERASYQSDDDNEEGAEEQLNHDWMIQDAADSDAADHVDQGSFVSSMNLNQHHRHTDSINLSKQQQQEEWFKGTLFYDDPGTAPTLPPKDYISINLDEHKKLYDQDIQSMYQQPSLHSLTISTKIGSSIKNRRRTITGKVRNALKKKSIFSRA